MTGLLKLKNRNALCILNMDLNIERLESEVSLNNMSDVCQFFASSDVIGETDALTILPTPTEDAHNTIMNEIVPHYIDVKKIFINGKLNEINVRCLKEESKKMIEDILSKGENSVLPDLYRTEHLNLPTKQRELKYFSVNKEKIVALHIKETNKISKFIKDSYFAKDGVISLQPRGWILEENLKESVSIRTFSTFAEQIVLVINNADKSVVGLDIYG